MEAIPVLLPGCCCHAVRVVQQSFFRNKVGPGKLLIREQSLFQRKKGGKTFCGCSWPRKNHCFVLALSLCLLLQPEGYQGESYFLLLGFTLSPFYSWGIWDTEEWSMLLVRSLAWIWMLSCLGVRPGGSKLEDKVEKKWAMNESTGNLGD